MNFKLLFVLFLVNNLLHHISEKVVIIIFLIIFYYLIKIIGEMLENEYQTKVSQINKDISNYLISVFDILKFYKNFFRNLFDFNDDFNYIFFKIKKNIRKHKLFANLKNNLLLLNSNNFYKYKLFQ